MKLYTEGTRNFRDALRKYEERSRMLDQSVSDTVAQIIDRVRIEGDRALYDFTRRFDGFDPGRTGIEAGTDEMKAAWESISGRTRKSLLKMVERIRAFHEPQVEKGYTVYNDAGGSTSLKSIPVGSAGIYVPGGKAAYPSTVLMNAIPAKIAGVREVCAAAPAPGGIVVDEVLAACHISGVDRLFRMGGAQAIAAFAFGTKKVPRVDVITGPGSIYVTEAKRQLFGTVGMDLLAGPSELVVLSDSKGDSMLAASDLISQAEHGEDSFVALVTDSRGFARKVMDGVERLSIREKRRKILTQSLMEAPVFFLKNMKKCIDVVNRLAPEHLSVQVENPGWAVNELRNAGTIFIGPYSPVAVGDYVAGINHTLPTGGSARFSSPLGVYSFMKRVNVVAYDRASLEKDLAHVVHLSRREGLTAHGNAATARLDRKRRR